MGDDVGRPWWSGGARVHRVWRVSAVRSTSPAYQRGPFQVARLNTTPLAPLPRIAYQSMQAQLQQSASHLKSIHLLRALLREASYLPDANARQYFRRYIVSRFRAYQPSQNATHSRVTEAIERSRYRTFKRRHISIINDRTRAMQRKGTKGLNYLRRANTGEAPCLTKILLLAYGRLGRRKYALLENLLRPDVAPEDGPEKPAPLQKLYYSNQRFLSFFDAPKTKSSTHYTFDISDRYSRLKAVVKSQCSSGVTLGRNIKRPHLVSPIHNVWQRPMPIKRARNNVKRWYADTMTKLLPPLPTAEWDSLQAMIEGRKWIAFTKPRALALELDPHPAREEELFSQRIHEALAFDKPSKADRPAGLDRPHTLNTRFMRRMYAKVLTYCCKLERDEKRNKWVAIWGSGLHGLSSRIYCAPTAEDLFAGVDSNGRIIRDGKEPQPDRPNEKRASRKFTLVPFYVDFLPVDHPVRKEADAFRHAQAQAQAKAPPAARSE